MAVYPQTHRDAEAPLGLEPTVWAPVSANVSEGPFVYLYCTCMCTVYAHTGVHVCEAIWYVFITHVYMWHVHADTRHCMHVYAVCTSVWCALCTYVSHTMYACANVCAQVSVCMSLDMQVSKNNCGVSQSLPSTHFPEGEVLPRRPKLWAEASALTWGSC